MLGDTYQLPVGGEKEDPGRIVEFPNSTGFYYRSYYCKKGYKCPTGSSEPIACITGNYQDNIKKGSCKKPGPGKRAPKTDEAQRVCEDGKYARSQGTRTTCKSQCAWDQYANKQKTGCVALAANRYCDRAEGCYWLSRTKVRGDATCSENNEPTPKSGNKTGKCSGCGSTTCYAANWTPYYSCSIRKDGHDKNWSKNAVTYDRMKDCYNSNKASKGNYCKNLFNWDTKFKANVYSKKTKLERDGKCNGSRKCKDCWPGSDWVCVCWITQIACVITSWFTKKWTIGSWNQRHISWLYRDGKTIQQKMLVFAQVVKKEKQRLDLEVITQVINIVVRT